MASWSAEMVAVAGVRGTRAARFAHRRGPRQQRRVTGPQRPDRRRDHLGLGREQPVDLPDRLGLGPPRVGPGDQHVAFERLGHRGVAHRAQRVEHGRPRRLRHQHGRRQPPHPQHPGPPVGQQLVEHRRVVAAQVGRGRSRPAAGRAAGPRRTPGRPAAAAPAWSSGGPASRGSPRRSARRRAPAGSSSRRTGRRSRRPSTRCRPPGPATGRARRSAARGRRRSGRPGGRRGRPARAAAAPAGRPPCWPASSARPWGDRTPSPVRPMTSASRSANSVILARWAPLRRGRSQVSRASTDSCDGREVGRGDDRQHPAADLGGGAAAQVGVEHVEQPVAVVAGPARPGTRSRVSHALATVSQRSSVCRARQAS